MEPVVNAAVIIGPNDGGATDLIHCPPMRRLQFECRVRLPVPRTQAFSFHLDPRNLGRISPPWARVVELRCPDTLVVGSEITVRVRMLGVLPQMWRVRIAEIAAPECMVDEALAGPFPFWRHTHAFRELEGGAATEMVDRVEYSPPLGLVGRIFDPWLVRPMVRAMFADRHARTVALMQAEAGR
jgi:ligand-binding SRPBCC domain-containing protein